MSPILRMHIMHAKNASMGADGLFDRRHFLGISGLVREVVQCSPAKFSSHLEDHDADDERRAGIEKGIALQLASASKLSSPGSGWLSGSIIASCTSWLFPPLGWVGEFESKLALIRIGREHAAVRAHDLVNYR